MNPHTFSKILTDLPAEFIDSAADHLQSSAAGAFAEKTAQIPVSPQAPAPSESICMPRWLTGIAFAVCLALAVGLGYLVLLNRDSFTEQSSNAESIPETKSGAAFSGGTESVEKQEPSGSATCGDEEYIVYNPARDEYYDSRFMTWNAEKGDYDYLTPSPSEWRRFSAENSCAEIPYEGNVPDSPKKAFDDYSNAESIPETKIGAVFSGGTESVEKQEPSGSATCGDEEYIVYNPARDEYYDSRFMTWNAEKGDYDYLTPSPSEWRRVSAENSCAEIPYEGTVPDSLKKAFDDYSNAMNRYYQERTENEPGFDTRSYTPFEDDKGSYRTMCSICAGEWDALYQIAASDGEYSNLAQTAVNGILLHGGQSSTSAGFYCFQMQERYKQASEAVRSLGESITAADCAELKAKYGYLIAPALQEAGRLDLLPINPESPCTDAEMLADFARSFAAV